MEKSATKLPYHLRLLRPFLNLSIQGKFYLLFSTFLSAFTFIGIHDFIFTSNFKGKLLLLKTAANAEQFDALLEAGHQHHRVQLLMALGAVIVIGMTCFFLVGLLVDLLREMKYRLDMLRMRGEYFPEDQIFSAIPVLTDDEIGKVAMATNDLLLGMRKLSVFRRTIEADESTREVYERLGVIFSQLLHIPYYVIYEIDEEGVCIAPVLTHPANSEPEICRLTDADICRAKRTGEPVSSLGFPGICPMFSRTGSMLHTCVPMITGGRVLGVVQFLFDRVDSKNGEDPESGIAGMAGMAGMAGIAGMAGMAGIAGTPPGTPGTARLARIPRMPRRISAGVYCSPGNTCGRPCRSCGPSAWRKACTPWPSPIR